MASILIEFTTNPDVLYAGQFTLVQWPPLNWGSNYNLIDPTLSLGPPTSGQIWPR